MHGIRMLAWLLAISPLIGGCRNNEARPATEDAMRILQAKQWGESHSAKEHITKAQNTQIEQINIPKNLPSPELLPITQAIYAQIIEKGSPGVFESYTERLPATYGKSLRMIAIKGGEFLMGSPANEPYRKTDEGPQRRVKISPFWISEIEIPWEIYCAFMENGRPRTKDGKLQEKQPDDELWDVVAQPTAPYTAMNLGMGNGYEHGMPAIAMSHHAALKFCEWLSAQTGHYYRLPTEAEWEYACRAKSNTAYCYGTDEARLSQYAWFWNNSNDRYQKVASKTPNNWGIYDMHGNVAEWVMDSYSPQSYSETKSLTDPIFITPHVPHVVRGGSWDDDPDKLRSAARRASSPEWNRQDPQNPKSLWYLTDGSMVGFRIVRPLATPDLVTMHTYWNFSKGQP